MATATSTVYSAQSGETIQGGRGVRLPSWIASEPLWTWFEVPNSKLSDCPPTVVSGGTASNKLGNYGGYAADKVNNIIYDLCDGGHGDYAGQEVNDLRLNTETPGWREIYAGSPANRNINGSPFNLDGKPSAAHPYWMQHYLHSLRRVVHFCRGGTSNVTGIAENPGGLPWANNDSYSKSFDLDANEYDAAPGYVQVQPNITGTDSALCFHDPRTDDVYLAANGGSTGLQKWTRTTNTWAKTASNDPNGREWYAGSAIDTARDLVLCVGSFTGTRNPFFMGLDGSDQPGKVFTGLGASALQLGAYPGVEYDEANDCFYVVANVAGVIEIWTVDAATLEVAAPTVGGTKPDARVNGIHNSARHFHGLGIVAVANRNNQNVKAIRVHEVTP